jgi:hypothetical protein
VSKDLAAEKEARERAEATLTYHGAGTRVDLFAL